MYDVIIFIWRFFQLLFYFNFNYAVGVNIAFKICIRFKIIDQNFQINNSTAETRIEQTNKTTNNTIDHKIFATALDHSCSPCNNAASERPRVQLLESEDHGGFHADTRPRCSISPAMQIHRYDEPWKPRWFFSRAFSIRNGMRYGWVGAIFNLNMIDFVLSG